MAHLFGGELLQVADAAAREKGIDREEIFDAMEQAIQKAGRTKYGLQHDIRAEVDRRTGEVTLARYREVVADDAEIEDEYAQIPVTAAQRFKAGVSVGDVIVDDLPPIDFGRVSAQNAKQVIVQRVREAERSRQYAEYSDRVGEVVNGAVKRLEFGNVIIDLGRAEAIIRRDELLPREHFRRNDRVRAIIYDVREETRGPQIFLSRTRPEFLISLFTQEVPEIYDGIIEIKAAARDPGSRAKIGVISHDSSIDPVGACVGMRGSRVQAVVAELQGERIDIIPWSEEPATFVVNALAPAEVSKIVIDEDAGRIDVVVPDDQLSLAIGRRGQNVRLASQVSGWSIDILTEQEESERRQEEARQRSQAFISSLDVDEVIAHLLVAEGFSTVEEVAFVATEELTEIEGFDEEIAEELKRRAEEFVTVEQDRLEKRRAELAISEDMDQIEGLELAQLVRLGECGILNLDDLADLASDEFRYMTNPEVPAASVDDIATLDAEALKAGIEGSAFSSEEADGLIMALRADWFDDEDGAEASADADETAPA
ncbi:MAG: transcription termination factor NusA [Alphaproteobacteria bacterium]